MTSPELPTLPPRDRDPDPEPTPDPPSVETPNPDSGDSGGTD